MQEKNIANKRIINFRPCAFGALLMCSAIFAATKIYSSLWYLAIMIAVPVALTIYYVLTKKFVRLVCFVMIFAIGLASSFATIETYSNQKHNDKQAVVSGRVGNIHSYYENTAYITLQNVKISYQGKVYSLAGNTQVSLYGYEDGCVDVGDKVAFESVIKSIKILDEIFDYNYYYKNSIKYTTTTNLAKTEIEQGSLNLVESIRDKTKQNLYKTLGEDNAGVAYAILFGDKTLIDDNIRQDFATSGAAHLLAVSGLHVSFLIALLYFVIDRLGINKFVKVSILAAILFVYCFICGFSPSVVRASIMGIIMILCTAAGGRYDSLSSLGLSCMILLLFRPMYLFDVGFLMSYGAVIGIVLLYKLLDKIKINNKYAKGAISAVWLTIVAQIGVLPITADYFGTFATYSIFTNIIIVPIFGISYMLLCITNLLVLIMPFLQFIMIVPKALFSFVITFNNVVASMPGAVINIFGFSIIGAIVFYIIIFVISRFVMINKNIKTIICCTLAALCATIILVVNLPASFNSNVARFDSQPYACLITTQDDGRVLVNPKVKNIDLVKKALAEQKIKRLDAIIFTDNETFSVSKIVDFVEYFDKPTVYVFTQHGSINNLKGFGINFVEYGTQQQLVDGNVTLCGYGQNNILLATKISINGKEMLFVNDRAWAQNSQYVHLVDSDVDCVYSAENIYQSYISSQYYIDADTKIKIDL